MAYLDLNTVAVGDKLAIDNDFNSGYRFCTATRVRKQFIEVTNDMPGHDGVITITKFSKATGRPMSGNSWDDRKRLTSAASAFEAIARKQLMDAIRNERRAIKSELEAIANGHWTADTLIALRGLVDRIEKAIE
jgi:hypothetical protein